MTRLLRPARRGAASAPGEVRHAGKWRLALESFDEMADDWNLALPPLALADAGYGDNFEFRQGLQDRKLSYVVGVKADDDKNAAHSPKKGWSN